MKNSSLNKSEAMHRSSLIENLKYSIFLELDSNSIFLVKNSFHGCCLIEFDMKKIEEIFLDFQGKIKSLRVNGEEVEIVHMNERIFIKSKHLIQFSNKIQIHYENSYSSSGYGINYFTDPEDIVK